MQRYWEQELQVGAGGTGASGIWARVEQVQEYGKNLTLCSPLLAPPRGFYIIVAYSSGHKGGPTRGLGGVSLRSRFNRCLRTGSRQEHQEGQERQGEGGCPECPGGVFSRDSCTQGGSWLWGTTICMKSSRELVG